jgi:hypothetical protein
MSDDLDPRDWEAFRASSHEALDRMIDFLRDARERPVWRKAPANVRQHFQSPLPRRPREFAEVLEDFEANIKPYSVGNTHPLFMGWVHGAGTPVGMVAEMLAAGLNANCGGRDHIGIEVERQIARWAAELFGFPQNATGLFVIGSSAANFLGLLVARDAAMDTRFAARALSHQAGSSSLMPPFTPMAASRRRWSSPGRVPRICDRSPPIPTGRCASICCGPRSSATLRPACRLFSSWEQPEPSIPALSIRCNV